jgi:hypothetical protein
LHWVHSKCEAFALLLIKVKLTSISLTAGVDGAGIDLFQRSMRSLEAGTP